MRIVSSITSVSWIPSEAIEGLPRLPFDMGVTHYDEPPPERIDQGFLDASATFRFANELRAFIEVTDGKITIWGQSGGGRIGVTRVRLTWKDTIRHCRSPTSRPIPR